VVWLDPAAILLRQTSRCTRGRQFAFTDVTRRTINASGTSVLMERSRFAAAFWKDSVFAACSCGAWHTILPSLFDVWNQLETDIFLHITVMRALCWIIRPRWTQNYVCGVRDILPASRAFKLFPLCTLSVWRSVGYASLSLFADSTLPFTVLACLIQLAWFIFNHQLTCCSSAFSYKTLEVLRHINSCSWFVRDWFSTLSSASFSHIRFSFQIQNLMVRAAASLFSSLLTVWEESYTPHQIWSKCPCCRYLDWLFLSIHWLQNSILQALTHIYIILTVGFYFTFNVGNHGSCTFFQVYESFGLDSIGASSLLWAYQNYLSPGRYCVPGYTHSITSYFYKEWRLSGFTDFCALLVLGCGTSCFLCTQVSYALPWL
jgi:hypothetical protein